MLIDNQSRSNFSLKTPDESQNGEKEEIFKALYSDDDIKFKDFLIDIRKYLSKFMEDAQSVVREMLLKPKMILPQIK